MQSGIPLKYEINFWKKNQLVVGVDEVGRGALAGPLVAAACLFSPETFIPDNIIVTDSKKLSPSRRTDVSEWIKKNATCWTIFSVNNRTIDKLGISKAGLIVLRNAVLQLASRLKHQNSVFVLSDYFHIPHLKGIGKKNQRAIVKGDEKVFSVAAASIIAKIHRDQLMQQFSSQHPLYGWEKNKGYATKEHQLALKKYGATTLHRKLFIRNFLTAS